jgi:hypothetical protein
MIFREASIGTEGQGSRRDYFTTTTPEGKIELARRS